MGGKEFHAVATGFITNKFCARICGEGRDPLHQVGNAHVWVVLRSGQEKGHPRVGAQKLRPAELVISERNNSALISEWFMARCTD